MIPVDVLVQGRSPVGVRITALLRAEGVRVAMGGDTHTDAPADVVLPVHDEPPHRLVAALGVAAARELVDWAGEGRAGAPDLDRCGVEWRFGDVPGDTATEARAAFAALGIRVEDGERGVVLVDAGVRKPPVVPDADAGPVAAELVVVTDGEDPWLADKVFRTPNVGVHWAGLPLARPRVSRACSVVATPLGAMTGARWADPFDQGGSAVPAMLERLAHQDFGALPAPGAVSRFVTFVSCDGLPLVGPVPGRPRVVACTGFGLAGATYGEAAARAVVAGILGRPHPPLPRCLRASRMA